MTYCKELVSTLKNNSKLMEQSFHSTFPGDEDIEYHSPLPGYVVYWKRHFHKYSLQTHGKEPYQILLTNPCTTKLISNSWIHVSHLQWASSLARGLSNWTSISLEDLKNIQINSELKTSQRKSRQHLK